MAERKVQGGNSEKNRFFQKEINALRLLEGEMLKRIKNYYRIGLTWTSNALEGNSLTESETKAFLEDGLTVGGKPLRDVFEVVDHAKAYNFMFTLLRDRCIDEQVVLKLHELFTRILSRNMAGGTGMSRCSLQVHNIPWLSRRRYRGRWRGCLSG